MDKAYLFGWIASLNTTSEWTIKVGKHDVKCLEVLRDTIDKDLPIVDDDDFLCLTVTSQHIGSDEPGLNTFSKDEMKWAYLRGYFDGNGSILGFEQTDVPECTLTFISIEMLDLMCAHVNIPHTRSEDKVSFYDTNCIDFLGKLYAHAGAYRLDSKYQMYVDWLTYKPYIHELVANNTRLPECYVYKTCADAVIPSKTKVSDAGYDLTVIKEAKKFLNNVTLYDTGIKVKVKHGMYAEVVPRSSLSKSGYMLANSIGIIDQGYNGNIYIALVKVDPSAPDIELPFKCCQLIFRYQVHVDIVEVLEEFEATSRGTGGFGSTGTK